MSSFNMTEFSSSSITKSNLPKFTYKKRKPKSMNIEEQNELLRFKEQNDSTKSAIDNTVTSSDLSDLNERNQGAIPSFIVGHIISEKELALASSYSSYRKLNDVFDEFSELQKQNKLSEKYGIKKSEKKSNVKKNDQIKNSRRGDRKRGNVGRNIERNQQQEITRRALKSKPINEINERVTDKNYVRRNASKKNNDEFSGKADTKIEKQDTVMKDITADKLNNDNNDKRIDIVDQEDDINLEQYNNNSEVEDWHDMHPILTSTPNSSLILQEPVNMDSDDYNLNEIGNILPDSLLINKDDGQNQSKENLSTCQSKQSSKQSSSFNEDDSEKTESQYSSKDIKLSLQQTRRFVLKPLYDDDDELETFYFKTKKD